MIFNLIFCENCNTLDLYDIDLTNLYDYLLGAYEVNYESIDTIKNRKAIYHLICVTFGLILNSELESSGGIMKRRKIKSLALI